MTFAEKLSTMMKQKNFTKSKLHEKSGVSRQSIGRYLKENKVPRESNILALAEALECSMYELLEGVEK